MRRGKIRLPIGGVLVAALAVTPLGGCAASRQVAGPASLGQPSSVAAAPTRPTVETPAESAASSRSAPVELIAHVATRPPEFSAEEVSPAEVVAPSSEPGRGQADVDALFAEADALRVEELVALVEQRNPSLAALYAAWRAAAARYPQEIALDDSMLDVMAAPESFSATSPVPESWSVQVSQQLPWYGKRAYRGGVASAGARAARWEAADGHLQIGLAARLAYADYAEAHAALALNESELRLAQEVHDAALVKYETNQAPQQDVLQAAVELAETRRRQLELGRQRSLAAARINALLHRHPAARVPEPEALPTSASRPPELDPLLAWAVARHPDLAAQAAKVDAARAAYCLAVREYYPDLDLYGRYDRYWFDREQQWSTGVALNLPVRLDRRRAAVSEAAANVRAAEAEYEARVASVRYDVAAARERLRELSDVLTLVEAELLPAAERNAQSARAAYETGRGSFLPLVEAQRQWLSYRRELVATAAEYARQRAELQRAVGSPIEEAPPAARN